MKINEAVQEYISARKRRVQQKTLRGYREKLEVFSTWCKQRNLELEQVNARIVDQFLEYLETTRKSTYARRSKISTLTLAGYVRAIKCFMNWCSEDEEFEGCVKPTHF